MWNTKVKTMKMTIINIWVTFFCHGPFFFIECMPLIVAHLNDLILIAMTTFVWALYKSRKLDFFFFCHSIAVFPQKNVSCICWQLFSPDRSSFCLDEWFSLDSHERFMNSRFKNTEEASSCSKMIKLLFSSRNFEVLF